MNDAAQHIHNLRAEIMQQENEMHRLVAQRDALLEALQELLDADNYYPWSGLSASELAAINKARAAIKKAEEEWK